MRIGCLKALRVRFGSYAKVISSRFEVRICNPFYETSRISKSWLISAVAPSMMEAEQYF